MRHPYRLTTDGRLLDPAGHEVAPSQAQHPADPDRVEADERAEDRAERLLGHREYVAGWTAGLGR